MVYDGGLWWIREFEAFDVGEEGYPEIGQVVRHYREIRALKPAELGTRLEMSTVTVRAMENKRTGLDSLTLRRRLATVLDIPLALLGLDSLHPADERLRMQTSTSTVEASNHGETPESRAGLGIGLLAPPTPYPTDALKQIPPEIDERGSYHVREHGELAWWVEEGYPDFDPGPDGYPLPGQVVKYYREIRKQQDSTWTQAGLGRALNLSDVAVRGMENNNESLDSMTRRRQLVFLLNIPPTLLGLDSLYYMPEVDRLLAMKKATTEVMYLDRARLTRYSKMLPVYWKGYYTSTLQKSLKDVVENIRDLRASLLDERGARKQAGLEILCRMYQFASTMARDRCNYVCAYLYAKQAIRFARNLGDADLIASSYMRRGFIYFEEGKIRAAIDDLDTAYEAARQARASLKGLIAQVGGNYHTHALADTWERRIALSRLDEAGQLAQSGPYDEDENFVIFNEGWYHAERAEALIQLKRLDDALEELQLASEQTPEEHTRRHAHIAIYQAKVRFLQNQLDEATDIALSTIGLTTESQSTIEAVHVLDLYNQLKQTTYGNSPSVARLGLMLRAI